MGWPGGACCARVGRWTLAGSRLPGVGVPSPAPHAGRPPRARAAFHADRAHRGSGCSSWRWPGPAPEAAEGPGGRGERRCELTTAGQRTLAPGTHHERPGYSPRHSPRGPRYSPRHSPRGGEWAEQPPAVCGSGPALRWPLARAAPRPSDLPAPEGAKGGAQRGAQEGAKGGAPRGAKRGALVLVGLSRFPSSGPGFGVVSGRTSSSAALGPGGGGVDGWGRRWHSSEPVGRCAGRWWIASAGGRPRPGVGRAGRSAAFRPPGRPGHPWGGQALREACTDDQPVQAPELDGCDTGCGSGQMLSQ